MLEIIPRQINKSWGGIAAGFMAAQLLGPLPIYDDLDLEDRGTNIRSYRASSMFSSFGTYSTPFMGESIKGHLEAPLAEFFSSLLSTQQRLGPEFEQVLFDNLWDLYAR
jgi:hypothetical protein